MRMSVGSLFAGIGGFDLGFQRAGYEIKWQVEIDAYCQKVLAKHWPNVKRYGDINEVTGKQLGYVDVITGGFPCQDISVCGKGAGIEGARSGLWKEMHRIICEVRPRYVVVENVAALLGRGIGTVLGDLAEIGYDAEWQCIPAAAFGAPHRRDRVWIIAYPERDIKPRQKPCIWPTGRMGWIKQSMAWNRNWETTLSEIRGMDDGLSRSVDRTDGLRNAIVPQIAEWIARRILESNSPAAGGGN